MERLTILLTHWHFPLLLTQVILIANLSFGQTGSSSKKNENHFLTSEYFDDRSGNSNSIRVAFYNVENLFDIYDDPDKLDNDFTPEGRLKWTDFKYQKKLTGLGKTLTALGGWEGAEIIGLCEVENGLVLSDLVNFSPLASTAYEKIHYESPDRRGIDVALLYRPDKMRLVHSEAVRVSDPENPNFKTRDILYTKMELQNEELHLFVNHWPSRRGGKASSEPKRKLAASILKSKIDSLTVNDPSVNILIMGDFNDYPDNSSLVEVLEANNSSGIGSLKNLMSDFQYKTGTHLYQGEWGVLDQFIVSEALVDEKGFDISPTGAQIFRAEWLLTKNSSGDETIFRTNQGPFYKGGYSDHLPIIVDLVIRK